MSDASTEGATSTIPAAPTSSDVAVYTPPAPASTTATPLALSLPYIENDFTADTNWLTTWGATTIDGNSGMLTMEATPATTGGTVILQNSGAWSNYTFNASVNWTRGETFGLMARYVDNNNYVLCEFDQLDNADVEMQLEQFVNGQESDIAQGYIENYSLNPGTFINASINVNGTIGTCTLDGHEVSNQGPDDFLLFAPFSGGIGFQNWDPASGVAKIVIGSVSVQQDY
jgi:hypothetical protein